MIIPALGAPFAVSALDGSLDKLGTPGKILFSGPKG